MRLIPYSSTHFGVKEATQRNDVLKDKFGAKFKKGNAYACLVEMQYLEAVLAEWPDVQYREEDFSPDWEAVELLHYKRQCQRAGNLMGTLRAAGYVIVDTGSRLKIWGPEEKVNSVFQNMPDIEVRLNNLYEFIISEAEQRSECDNQYVETSFVPRGASVTLSEVHWKGLKQ